MTPTFPALLGRYCLLDELERGGLATTYLGTSMDDGGASWLAVKVLHPHLAVHPQFVAMFMDDARVAQTLRHPNVVQGVGAGQEGPTSYLVSEYLHGPPLTEVMSRARAGSFEVSAEVAAAICADIAEGLHAAHSMVGQDGRPIGLVHRKVTPASIAVTCEGVAKLSGFDIIKASERLAQETRSGELKGVIAYMSPEQVRGAELDRTTDVFALGVVLWELSTQQQLFRADTDFGTLEKVNACAVPPPSSVVRGGYPPLLEWIVMKALAKPRGERFQTALELAEALRGFLLSKGVAGGRSAASRLVCQDLRDWMEERAARLDRAGRLAAGILRART